MGKLNAKRVGNVAVMEGCLTDHHIVSYDHTFQTAGQFPKKRCGGYFFISLEVIGSGQISSKWSRSKSVAWLKSCDRSCNRKQLYHDQMTSCLSRCHFPFSSLKCCFDDSMRRFESTMSFSDLLWLVRQTLFFQTINETNQGRLVVPSNSEITQRLHWAPDHWLTP